MAFWFIIIILSYLFFSLAFFGDKMVLAGPPYPKVYVFYIGILNALVILLIPFIKFGVPDPIALTWAVFEALAFLLGTYAMFSALEKFDVSQIMPVIGALQPIFIFALTWIFFGPQTIKWPTLLAFALLILGSFIISMEKIFNVNAEYLKIVLFSSLMFSLDYIFFKLVFQSQPFWHGLIWTRIFVFIFVLTFLFGRNFRKDAFSKKAALNKKTGALFFLAQLAGGLAGLLQSFAISLVPVAYLAVMNSLRGIQYIFLFLITIFSSYFFPKILMEKMSKRIIIQKTASILIITLGLAILILY